MDVLTQLGVSVRKGEMWRGITRKMVVVERLVLGSELDRFVAGQRHKLAKLCRSIPRKWYGKEFLPLVHVRALCQAIIVVLFDLVENGSVGIQRQLNRQPTRGGQHEHAPSGTFIVLSSALNLELHHVLVILVDNLVFNLFLGDTESFQVFLWQVDATALHSVFSDVPQNVGELKGDAQGQSGFTVGSFCMYVCMHRYVCMYRVVYG